MAHLRGSAGSEGRISYVPWEKLYKKCAIQKRGLIFRGKVGSVIVFAFTAKFVSVHEVNLRSWF